MGIFLSYRRADSELVVGPIYDKLILHFPIDRVFRDLDSLPIGRSFPQALDEAIANARVALIVIGPMWASIAGPDGRPRLHNPADFVRIEVEKALAAGFPVVPVFVNRARIPNAEELPESLGPLLSHQGVEVRPDPDFHRDMDRLVSKLSSMLEQSSHPRSDPQLDLMGMRFGSELGELWLRLYVHEHVPDQVPRPSEWLLRVFREWNDRSPYLGTVTADPNLLRSTDLPEVFVLAARLVDLRRSRLIEIGYRLVTWWAANNGGPQEAALFEPYLFQAVDRLDAIMPGTGNRITKLLDRYRGGLFNQERYAKLVNEIVGIVSK